MFGDRFSLTNIDPRRKVRIPEASDTQTVSWFECVRRRSFISAIVELTGLYGKTRSPAESDPQRLEAALILSPLPLQRGPHNSPAQKGCNPMRGTWQPLAHPPSFAASTMLLLTDGTVMCQQSCSNQWWKLSPDPTGSYIQGSWTPLAPSPNAPLYYASAVLADGRVFVAG